MSSCLVNPRGIHERKRATGQEDASYLQGFELEDNLCSSCRAMPMGQRGQNIHERSACLCLGWRGNQDRSLGLGNKSIGWRVPESVSDRGLMLFCRQSEDFLTNTPHERYVSHTNNGKDADVVVRGEAPCRGGFLHIRHSYSIIPSSHPGCDAIVNVR
jgi:hypothetical protein